jgi:hypothetical protein
VVGLGELLKDRSDWELVILEASIVEAVTVRGSRG